MYLLAAIDLDLLALVAMAHGRVLVVKAVEPSGVLVEKGVKLVRKHHSDLIGDLGVRAVDIGRLGRRCRGRHGL